MAFNTKTFFTRLASAVVFTAVLLTCVNYSYYTFTIFFTSVGLIGLNEFYKLSEKLNKKPQKITGYLIHFILISIVICAAIPYFCININLNLLVNILACFALVGPLIFLMELFSGKKIISKIPATILANLYVSVPCALLILMSANFYLAGFEPYSDFTPQKVIGCILFIWINDTGAYLVGSFFGKHKLYEKISPAKTWEGTIGGIILSIGLAYCVFLIYPQLAYKHWIAIAIIVSVIGTLGDLVESQLKRTAGVKDTGNIMPGHGGVLDRFDSLFFSIPFVFCYLAFMKLL